MKRILVFALLLAALPMLAAAVPLSSLTIPLVPTKAGAELDAHGAIMLERMARGMETFTLAASAKVPNRDLLVVRVVTKSTKADVSAVRMFCEMGTLDLWNTIDPSPVFPLEELVALRVYYGSTLVLTATF